MNTKPLFVGHKDEDEEEISPASAASLLKEFYQSEVGDEEIVVVNNSAFSDLHTAYVRDLEGENGTRVTDITHYPLDNLPPVINEIRYYTGSERKPLTYNSCDDPSADDITYRNYQRGISLIELSTGDQIAYLHVPDGADYAAASPDAFHRSNRMMNTQTIAEVEPGVHAVKSGFASSAIVQLEDFDEGGKVFHQRKSNLIEEVNNFFDNVEVYLDHGGTGVRSCLLYGEPGTGKTQLARTLVSEHAEDKLTGITTDIEDAVKLSEFAAQENMPAVIVLEDVEYYFEQAPSSLLNWMDGSQQSVNEAGTFLIYTTNHLDDLSAQVRRPGRIDKEIYFGPLGDVSMRQCLSYYLPEEAEVGANQIVDELEGKQPGAVLRDLIKRAQSIAISRAETLSMVHIEEAIDSIKAQKQDADNYEFAA